MIYNKVVSGGTVVDIPSHLSFGQYVIERLRDTKDDIAYIDGESGVEVTRKGFLQKVVNAAVGLKRLGVRKGDVVAVCSENRLEILVSALGAICCGATVTTANILYTAYELNHVLKISKPKYIFCSVTALKAHITSLKKFSLLKTIIQYDDERPIDRSIVLYSSLFTNDADVLEFEAEDIQGCSDVAFVLYSSGTTGLPKGVMLTHVNLLVFSIIGNNDKDYVKRYLTVMPWYHGYGLLTSITFMLKEKTMIYFTAFKPQLYLNAIQKYKVEVLMTVPPLIVFLNKSPMVDNYELGSVKLIWCAAAPLSGDTVTEAMKRFPNCRAILQAYGMTETTLAVTLDKEDEKSRPGSGGTPVAGVKMKVVDINTRKRLDKYEQGEICVKGPNLMKGYMGNKEASQDILDDEGYLKTGDIGYYDDEGYFYVVDRLKELIKYKGHQVPPAEVESVLLQHPGVAECAVVGLPDASAGELATAFVVPKPGISLAEKEIVEFAAAKLSPVKQLHGGVLFVEEIPKNASGKILRRVLKEKLKQQQKSKL